MNRVLPKEKIQALPKRPGCYLMKNEAGEIIYVGKAKNLAERVKSYFTGMHNGKTNKLVSLIADLEWIVTSTEKEALILEINLIKKHRPKYNIMLTDDKRYPYIRISAGRHPMVFYTRDLGGKGKYFGPYPDAGAAKAVATLLNRIYPFRKCRRIPTKPCLYYHLNNCLGPCINDVKPERYESIVAAASELLRGNVRKEKIRLEKEMKEAAANMDFERAKEIKEIIADLEKIAEKQKMETDLPDCDVFGYAVSDDYLFVQVLQVRSSKVIGKKNFVADFLREPKQMFKDCILYFYLVNNNPLPKEIIVPEAIAFAAPELAKRTKVPKKGRRKELLEMVKVNIEQDRESNLLAAAAKKKMTEEASAELAGMLKLESCRIIEAFDNSNLMGEAAVSAMVRYTDGVKSPSDYRRYRIKNADGKDDPAMIEEVIGRRYGRLLAEKAPLPDLIIVDGGISQVKACRRALEKLEADLPVIGLVKDEKHRTKAIFDPDGTDPDNEKILDRQSSLYRFLSGIQDETHRYAIGFHRRLRDKKAMESRLDDIRGIGPVKKKMISEIAGDPDFKSKLEDLPLTDEQKRKILNVFPGKGKDKEG